MYLIFPTFSKSAPRNIEVNTKRRKNKMRVISYEDARAIKQRGSDASRYHQAAAINSG